MNTIYQGSHSLLSRHLAVRSQLDEHPASPGRKKSVSQQGLWKSLLPLSHGEARKERLPSTHSLLMVPKSLPMPLSWVLWHKLTVEKAPGLLYRTCLKEGECIPPVKKAPVLTVSRVSDESSFTTEAPHSCSILSSSSVEDGCKITVSHTCTPCPRQSSLSGGSQFLF